MFWRTAVILLLVAQPALSLAVTPCAAPSATVEATSCCCCDSACPSTCPCIGGDETPDRAPLAPAPATPPGLDQLLLIPSSGGVIGIIAADGQCRAASPSPAIRATPSSRALRTLIGVWTT